MEAVFSAAIRYQALHLPDPQGALRHTRQQTTKAWAQHGGWPTSFPKDAMRTHWRYYRDNTCTLVDTAYTHHAAHLLHRMTHTTNPRSAKLQPYALRKRKRPAMPALGRYWHSTASPPPWAPEFGPSCNFSYRTTHMQTSQTTIAISRGHSGHVHRHPPAPDRQN